MSNFQRLMYWFKRRPGLVILIILLILISIPSIKPGFYLTGWDNYSSYFRPEINIFRTFFSAWREYRGLGSASDAEVTDVFRQLLYVPLRLFMPEQLLDQAYYILSLWLGILGMYIFAGSLFQRKSRDIDNGHIKQDLIGCVAGFFYLFNLNTLSVFYSPLIPFTNRFWALPLTLYTTMRFIDRGYNKKDLLIFILTLVLTTGSYITPTVLITNFIAFFLFLTSYINGKKALVYCTVFLCLNAFWLLPFLNYTREKADIVPLARTFVEINESTLNRNPSTFSLDKQTILMPSFFDITFPTIDGRQFPIHPLLGQYQMPFLRLPFYLFPILYGIGLFIIVVHYKSLRHVLWIPVWIVVFLFLSGKEYGPFGFLYTVFKNAIPYFDVIFRISDTKFHAYISFAGSLAAAYAIDTAFRLVQKLASQGDALRSCNRWIMKGIGVLLVVICVGYGWMFRTYFTGNLITPLAFVKIPRAYFALAESINTVDGNGRVLHLPMDSWHHYWRSFSWGYIGSSFFNFFINKPYIDKTFEPASLEQSYLHAKITRYIDSFYQTTSAEDKDILAMKFFRLLQDIGIQFVIVDESISASMYTRNIQYSAQQSWIRSKEIIEYLAGKNLIMMKETHQIDLAGLYTEYASLYPTNFVGMSAQKPATATVRLYEVLDIRKMVSMLDTVENVDPAISNLLETDADTLTDEMIQDPEKPSMYMPFFQQNHRIEADGSSVSLRYTEPLALSRTYTVHAETTTDDSYLIDVFGRKSGDTITLTFAHEYYPTISGNQFSRTLGSIDVKLPLVETLGRPSKLLGNWPEEVNDTISEIYRLSINDSIFPLPLNIGLEDRKIATVLIHEPMIRTVLLTKEKERSISLESFSQTDPLPCVGSHPKDFVGEVVGGIDIMRIRAQSGSACVQAAIPDNGDQIQSNLYYEVEADIQTNDTGSLQERVLQGYACVKEGSIDRCLNPKSMFRLANAKRTYRFPLRSPVSSLSDLSIIFGFMNPDRVQAEMNIEKVLVHTYVPSVTQEFGFSPQYPAQQVRLQGPLTVTFPKAISLNSYIHNPNSDGYIVAFEPCKGENPSDRRMKFIGNTLITSMTNCSMYAAENFLYRFGSPYLFTTNYWLGSGQQPVMVLGHDRNNILLERLSLYQGYPNLAGMKQAGDLNKLHLTTASRFIEPQAPADTKDADMTIHVFQDTENLGLTAIKSIEIIEYPRAWYTLTLKPEGSSLVYPTGSVSTPPTFHRLLPSLWKVNEVSGTGLLLFNQGYDRQWGLYDSVWSVLFGKPMAESVRCGGFANCFELKNESRPPNDKARYQFYIFYLPERLAMAGWGVTLLIGITLFMIVPRKRERIRVD